MKKKQYKTPQISVFEIKTTLLSESETMNVDSSNTVTNDGQVFSRYNDFFWSDEEDEIE